MAKRKVDNFEALKNILTFKNEGEFYPVFVIKRSKDENMEVRYDESLPYVFDSAIFYSAWTITSVSEFMEKKPEIISLCEEKNARAYLVNNSRTFDEINEIEERIRKDGRKPGYERIMAISLGLYYFCHYDGNGLDPDAEYAEWLEKHPRVLVDVDIDSEVGLRDVAKYLYENNIDVMAEADTPNGGKQFACEGTDVEKLDFSSFDVYERVGRIFCDPDDPCCEPAVHCLRDIGINLYSNLK